MKKLLLTVSLLLLIAVPVLAEEAATVRTRTENRLELMQQKREEFKQRVQEIQDANKQKIAERINTQLNHINQQATAAMARHLDRMENLLDRLRSRVIKAKERGLDTSATEAAIDKAQAAIDSARAAVEAQAEKEYLIEFTDESGLRIGASNAKTGLRNDLKAVREKVRAARQAVVDALKAAKAMYAKASPLPEVSP